MQTISFDPSIDLADRIKALEAAVVLVIDAINAIPAVDAASLLEQLDAVKTDLDAIDNRLDSDEKTLLAISDALKTLSPETTGNFGSALEEVKATIRSIYIEIMGPAGPNIPYTPAPPETSSN